MFTEYHTDTDTIPAEIEAKRPAWANKIDVYEEDCGDHTQVSWSYIAEFGRCEFDLSYNVTDGTWHKPVGFVGDTSDLTLTQLIEYRDNLTRLIATLEQNGVTA